MGMRKMTNPDMEEADIIRTTQFDEVIQMLVVAKKNPGFGIVKVCTAHRVVTRIMNCDHKNRG